jgi:hypothetical protein
MKLALHSKSLNSPFMLARRGKNLALDQIISLPNLKKNIEHHKNVTLFIFLSLSTVIVVTNMLKMYRSIQIFVSSFQIDEIIKNKNLKA